MHILKTSIFFFLALSFLSTTKSTHENLKMSDNCLTQVCSYNEPISRNVQFPFLITNDSMPRSCGYPGFDLLCNGNDRLLINLPNLGAFSVEEINYIDQELWLNDPDNCLPKKLLAINGSSFVGKSSFFPIFEKDYWFHNCSTDFFNSLPNIMQIECLSGTTYGVFASPLEKIVKGNSSLCSKIGPIKVPVGPNYKEEDYSLHIIRADIRLTWSQPLECGKCYERDGRCRFKSNSSLEVECFNLPRHGLTRQTIIAIGLAFAAPLTLVTCCITYFFLKAVRHRRGHGARATLPLAITPQPHIVLHGLDRSIIDSYPKTVLGESRRLPKPDDINCPICLGEYMSKESLRTIPDCGHSFHVDCIDEWLQLNASCPVCRNSPYKILENHSSS